MPGEFGTRTFGGDKSDQTRLLPQETHQPTDKNRKETDRDQKVPLAYEQASLSSRNALVQTGERNSMGISDSNPTQREREIKLTLGEIHEVSDKPEGTKLEPNEIARREQLQMDLTSLVQRADTYVSHTNAFGNMDPKRDVAGKTIEKTIHSIDTTRFTTSQELRAEIDKRIQADKTINNTTRRKATKILEKTQQITIRDELFTRLDRTTRELSERNDLDKGQNGDRIQKFSQTMRRQINEAFRASKLKQADTFLLDAQAALGKDVQTQLLRGSHAEKVQRRDSKQHVVNEFIKSMQEVKPIEDAEANKREVIGKVERLQTIWRQSMLEHKVTQTIDSYIPSNLPPIASAFTGADRQQVTAMKMVSELSIVKSQLEAMNSEAFKDKSWLQELHVHGRLGDKNRYNAAGVEQACTNLDLRDELARLAYRSHPQEHDQKTPRGERMKKTIAQFENTLDHMLIRSKKAIGSQDHADIASYTKPDRDTTIDDIAAKMTRNVNRQIFIKDESRARKLEFINNLADAIHKESD